MLRDWLCCMRASEQFNIACRVWPKQVEGEMPFACWVEASEGGTGLGTSVGSQFWLCQLCAYWKGVLCSWVYEEGGQGQGSRYKCGSCPCIDCI